VAKPFGVRLTASAEADLVGVAAWYAGRHASGADRFVREFDAAGDVLRSFPDAGRVRSEFGDMRSWPVHPFVVFYCVDVKRRTIWIQRVIHGAMDLRDVDGGDIRDT
jgi:plasmid stabilization system protein ParE